MKIENAKELAIAVESQEPVEGFTHSYYRYPARFSPQFVRAAIKMFTEPGELVLDPFTGGGTTLLEAFTLGRQSIGLDINSLAVFVAKTKLIVFSDLEIEQIGTWLGLAKNILNVHRPTIRPLTWLKDGYLKNLSNKKTWPIRKTIELALQSLDGFSNDQCKFIRCLFLRTGQWALDCRRKPPSVVEFREKLNFFFETMASGLRDLRKYLEKDRDSSSSKVFFEPKILQRSAIGLENDDEIRKENSPKLILTSPPYPGVHVLYHRWQIQGRRETPAPYWIADCFDGNGASYYTLGDRKKRDLPDYFQKSQQAFTSLGKIATKGTYLVQLIAFTKPEEHLPLYLKMLEEVGFSEVFPEDFPKTKERRIWRNVPNRKFYADYKGALNGSNEVLLIHQKI